MNPIKLQHHAQFHGANRLADKSSRWYWIPSLLILLASAITLVIMAISRYEDVPTSMVQIEKGFIERPFPSVLLCPEINFVNQKMDQFLSEVKYPGDMNASEMREILPQLGAFYTLDVSYNIQDLMRVEQLLDYNSIDVETAGRLLTASCEETLIKCRWGRSTVNCSDIFRMELTGDGFCCVFNGRSLRREMEEHGTNIRTSIPERQWHTKRFGYDSGLMIAVNQSQKPASIDLSYKWLALETSQHFVDTTSNGTALNPGYEQWISYYTRNFQITEGAKALSASLRRCNISSEKLSYFPMYNKKYCLLEQEMAKTLENCKCVSIVHPKPPGTSRCRSQMLRCAKQNLVAYDNLHFRCPRTCDVESSYSKATSFQLDDTVKPIDSFYKGLDFKRVTVVRVYMQNRKMYTNELWAYFTYIDLFSQLGGIFNVFFGCSILTLLGLLQLAWRVAVTQWQRLRK